MNETQIDLNSQPTSGCTKEKMDDIAQHIIIVCRAEALTISEAKTVIEQARDMLYIKIFDIFGWDALKYLGGKPNEKV